MGLKLPIETTLNDGNQFEKHFFLVIETGALPSGPGNEQVIFEQGGGTNGINIHINAAGNLVFYAYEDCDGGSCYEAIATSTSALSANTSYVLTAVFDAVVGTGNPVTRLYLNGALQAEINLSGTLLETDGIAIHTGNIVLGASGGTQMPGNTDIGIGFTFAGNIAEMIYYNQGIEIINEARRRIIEASLAAKYDIVLDFDGDGFLDAGVDDLFSFGNSHPMDIIGIGKISDSDESHREAQGLNPFNIQFNNVAAVNDNEFVMIGHDGVSLSAAPERSNIPTAMTMSGGAPTPFDNRLSRTYCSAITGTPGNVDMLFDLSAYAIADPADVQLVFDDDGDFTDATVFMEPTTTTVFGGSTFVGFDNVSLSSGEFFTIASVSPITILPVELSHLSGKAVVEEIHLDWATAQEYNNDYFEVQRSTDGNRFESIGSVKGVGTTNESSEYTFIDTNPSYGINYYRLRQVDYDGTEDISRTILVNLEVPEIDFTTMVYPNPASLSEMKLYLETGDIESPVELSLVGIDGRSIATRVFKANSLKGDYDLFGNLKLTPGVYNLIVKQSNSQSVIKVLSDD